MDKLSQTDECVTIRRCKVSRLLFSDDSVLLDSSISGLLHALNGFAAACDIAEIKLSSSKTEVLRFSRNLVQYCLQVGEVLLKQMKKFQIPWGDVRQNEELILRSDKESAVMRCNLI